MPYPVPWTCRLTHHTLRLEAVDASLMMTHPGYGAVAQLGERSVRNAEVEGSIPFRSTGNFSIISGKMDSQLVVSGHDMDGA
jgi:hypothetical protein